MQNGIYKLILTSRGLGTDFGKKIIKDVFKKEKLKPGRIFLLTLPKYEMENKVIAACKEIGFEEENIFLARDYMNYRKRELPSAEYIYVGMANTFDVMDWIRKNYLGEYIKETIQQGAYYIGASSGAILASGEDFLQAKYIESNFPNLHDFTAFGLMPDTDTCLPHYTDEQLHVYMEDMSESEIAHYSHVYSISNEEALLLDCKLSGGKVELIRQKKLKFA